MPRLGVIIPTLNEAPYLPGLLDALNAQTRPPDEIIVADAGSRDETVDLARERGAQVVQGGMPAMGRNAGAQVATGEFFQFFDADVLPRADFVARATDEFARGEIAPAILNAIKRADADLVVMATHGRTSMDAFWSGSVTPKVLAQSNAPVLLVRVTGEETKR